MRVVELNGKKLVGLRVVCSGDEYAFEIPKAAVKLKERLNEINDVLSPARLVGAFVVGDFSEEEDGYWVCVEVNKVNHVPEGMVSIEIPAQRYAVVRHTGSHAEIGNTYEDLHKWIANHNFERIHRAWHLEIADEWGHHGLTEFEIDLYDTIK